VFLTANNKYLFFRFIQRSKQWRPLASGRQSVLKVARKVLPDKLWTCPSIGYPFLNCMCLTTHIKEVSKGSLRTSITTIGTTAKVLSLLHFEINAQIEKQRETISKDC